MQIVGAVINIILDPIFIFGYFGLPAMGTRGAAIATVAGQIIAMLLGLYFNLTKNTDVQFDFKCIKLESYYFKGICTVGIPTIIMQSIGSVMTYCNLCPALCVLALTNFFWIFQQLRQQYLEHILNYRHLCIWQFLD